MREGVALSDSLAKRASKLLWRLTVATAVLFLSVASFAQDSKPGASVEEAFSGFHQALTATATNLLAEARRPVFETPSRAVLAAKETSAAATSVSVFEKEWPVNQKNQALTRLEVLRPVLEQILTEEAVPPELAGIVLVESDGVPTALSPKGARGIWQFMPDTARRYGLAVGPELDERLDIYKSTHAAARYLRDLYSQFGSWPLAFAAYNAGEELVGRAVVRSSSRDFDVIARAGLLPPETIGYVPAVMKAIELMKMLKYGRVTTAARKGATRQAVYALSEMEN